MRHRVMNDTHPHPKLAFFHKREYVINWKEGLLNSKLGLLAIVVQMVTIINATI